MQGDYIGIEYDRSHLTQSYQFSFLPSFEHPLDTLDLIVIIIDILLVIGLIALFIYKSSKMPKQRQLQIQKPQKNNVFPFFNPIKNQRKGKNRQAANKQMRDHTHLQLICQKCKYITEINQKNLITDADRH